MHSSRELYSCRFCAEKKPLSDLLNLEANPEYIKNCLEKTKFLKIDFVDISSNKLPKFICECCNDALSDAYTFILKVKEAQTILNYISKIKCELFEENEGIRSIKHEQMEESSCGEITHDNDMSLKSLSPSSGGSLQANTSNSVDNKISTDKNDNSVVYKQSQLEKSLRELLLKNGFDTQNKIYIFDFINNETLEICADGLKGKPFIQNMYTENATLTQSEPIKTEPNHTAMVTFTEVPITNIVTLGQNSALKDTENQGIEENVINFPDYSNLSNANVAGFSYEEKLFETDKSDELDTLVNPLCMFTSATQVLKDTYDCPNNESKNNSDMEATELIEIVKNEPSLLIEEFKTVNVSWAEYTWLCQHCDTKCDSMEDLREHSKLLHNKCCGYKCVDCPEPFITFTAFIEHVKWHRPSLRLYCQFCNKQFPSPEDCTTHSYNHWFENKTCERCGEQLPDAEGLKRHKRRFKKSLYPTKYKRRVARSIPNDDTFSWEHYECICWVCHLKTSDMETLRKHAEDVHVKCFVNKCVDCLFINRDFKSFVIHVLQHRPWLDIPCPYCSELFTRDKAPMKHLRKHETEQQKVCNQCVQMFEGKRLQEHVEKFNVHGHKFSLTCDVCFKEFKVKAKLTAHKTLKHSEVDRTHVCDVCGRSYPTFSSFKNHIVLHMPRKDVCEYCQQSFPTPYALKAHVKTHLNLQDKYSCNYCGKSYKRKSCLKYHIVKCHTTSQEMFKCQYCDKTFSRKEYRRNHEFLHTGHKPYHCQKCPLSFTNWGNCNKHMIRRHGVTLAKTRRTTTGRLRVNETGQVLEVKENVKEWLYDVASQASFRKKK